MPLGYKFFSLGLSYYYLLLALNQSKCVKILMNIIYNLKITGKAPLCELDRAGCCTPNTSLPFTDTTAQKSRSYEESR